MVSNPNILLSARSPLELQGQASRNNLLDVQARELASRAISRGSQAVGNVLAQNSPMAQQMRQNALTRDNVVTADAERALVAPLLDQVERSPDPATAYAAAVQFVESKGIDIDPQFETYSPEGLRLLKRFYSMPEQEMTAFERDYALRRREMGDDLAFQWLLTDGGLAPDANAVLRSQSDDAPSSPSGYRRTADGGLEFIPGGPADPALRQAQRGNGITYTDKDGNRIQIGGNPGKLGRKATNQLETDFIGTVDRYSQLEKIREYAGIGEDGRMSPEAARILTYQGQVEDWVSAKAEKLGVDIGEVQRDALRQRTQFNTAVEQGFNCYRQEITGAAAAVQELDRLKKSFLNIDMSPSQFEAAFAQYQAELLRAMRIQRMFLRQGIDPNTQEGGRAFDQAFLGAADDDPAIRYRELLEEFGGDEEQAYEQLGREGF